MGALSNLSYSETPIASPFYKMLLPILVFEFGLLSMFWAGGITPVLALTGMIVFLALVYAFYRNSMHAVLALMFSVVAGPLAVVKVAGKAPAFLWLDVALFLAVIVMMVRWPMEWDGKIKMHPIAKSFLLFLGWGALTTLQAVDMPRAIVLLRSYFSGLVAFLLVYKTVQTEKEVRKICVALLLWAICLSLIEIYNLLQYGGLTMGIIGVFLYKNLMATSWGKSNYLAAFDVLLIPFALAVFLTKTSRHLKSLIIIALALMTTALILSLSRGGLIACFVAVLIVLARFLSLRTFLPIIAMAFAIGLVVFLNPLTFVLIERTATLEQSASVYSRLDFWKETWQIFQAHPITGVGLGNLGYYAAFVTAGYSSAHNIALGLLAEMGIVGFMLFVFLMAGTFRAFAQSLKIAQSDFEKHLVWGAFCSLIGALLHSLLEPNFEGVQFSVMVWTIIGLVAKLPRLASEPTASRIGA